jgi:hypothetical protein
MRGRVRIPIVVLIWVIIGVLVAVNKGYGEVMDTASNVATFMLAVALWPIPALDGQVAVIF